MNLTDLRLVLEVGEFDKGGLQKVVLDSACEFRAHGIETTIVSLKRPGLLGDQARARGIEVVDLERTAPGAFLRRVLAEKRINLACSHFSGFGYPYYAEAGIPNLTFIHNVYAFLRGEAQERFRADDARVDRYIAVSRAAARYAVKRLGVPESKVTVIGNGLIIPEHEERDRRTPPADRAALGLRAEDYVFVNVASYNLHKGHYLMAAAMKEVLKSRRDVKIVCIGNVIHPPHAEAFQAYLRAQGLADHLLLPGYFEHAEAYYKMADAFLLPSFIEGWSIAMNEAMFYGKPLLMTRTGAAEEVIENGDIGLLVENEYGEIGNLDSALLDAMAYDQREFKTAPALAAAMLDFASRREHWAAAGKRGRAKILDRHRFDQVMARYEEVFLEVARQPKAKSGRAVEAPAPGVGLASRLKGRLKRLRWVRRFWQGWLPALAFWAANSVFMRQPSYRLRHFFLRRFCGIRIGRDSSLLTDVYVSGPQIEIGDHTVINRHVYLDGRAPLKIGNNVNVSHYVLIQTLTHDPQHPDFVCLVKPVIIEDHVWIGARALILPGVRIGEGAVIGAGAVVTRDVPPYTVAVGNPARVVKERNREIRYQTRYFPLFNTDIQLPE